MGTTLIALALLLTQAVQGAEPSCEELNHLWDTKFHADLHVAWPKKDFRCPSDTSLIALAAYDVYTPRFNPPARGELMNFYGFLKDQILSLHFTHTPIQGLLASTDLQGAITLRPTWMESDTTRLSRATNLLHEASHAAAKAPDHVVCTKGVHKGLRRCDPRFSKNTFGKMTAFSLEIFFMRWVRDGSNYDAFTKKELTAEIKYILDNSINEFSDADYRMALGLPVRGTDWVPKTDWVPSRRKFH